KPTPKPRAEGKHFGHDILDGLHYVWRNRAMRAFMILMIGVNFCVSGPIFVGLAALGKFKFGSPTAFGILFSSYSAGAVIGTIFAGVRKQKRHRGWTMILASAIVSLGIAALGVLTTEPATAAVLATAGVVRGSNNI